MVVQLFVCMFEGFRVQGLSILAMLSFSNSKVSVKEFLGEVAGEA